MQSKEVKINEMEKALRMISAHIKQKGREILNDFSITPPQFVALQWLFEQNEMTIGDLSNKMYLAYSTTTDLIDRMEKNGLVRRIRDPKDRRVVRIQKLEKGYEIIEEVIKRRQNYLKALTEQLSDEEMESLHQSLHLLYDKMNSVETN